MTPPAPTNDPQLRAHYATLRAHDARQVPAFAPLCPPPGRTAATPHTGWWRAAAAALVLALVVWRVGHLAAPGPRIPPVPAPQAVARLPFTLDDWQAPTDAWLTPPSAPDWTLSPTFDAPAAGIFDRPLLDAQLNRESAQ